MWNWWKNKDRNTDIKLDIYSPKVRKVKLNSLHRYLEDYVEAVEYLLTHDYTDKLEVGKIKMSVIRDIPMLEWLSGKDGLDDEAENKILFLHRSIPKLKDLKDWIESLDTDTDQTFNSMVIKKYIINMQDIVDNIFKHLAK